jgi:hypothetical protein
VPSQVTRPLMVPGGYAEAERQQVKHGAGRPCGAKHLPHLALTPCRLQWRSLGTPSGPKTASFAELWITDAVATRHYRSETE